MEKKTFSLNRGIFCGKLTEEPKFNHSIIDEETNEVIREYFLLEVEVLFENRNKTIKDVSILPVLITKEQLSEVGDIGVGDIVFVRGEWRAYSQRDENNRRVTTTRVLARRVEKIDDYTRTRNKIEFHGYLKRKLFKAEFDEDGNLVKKDGRLVPVLDEEGKMIPWTRRNNEGLTVNDFILQVKREIIDENGEIKVLYQDFIPAISYGVVAHQIANEIDINDKVKARGYIRRREKNGFEGEYVYEAVITRIHNVTKEEKEREQKESTQKEGE